MENKTKIGIVTPLRNEINSINELFKSIDLQTISIHYWLIIENDSTDGSQELLKEMIQVKHNVDHIEVVNQKSTESTYALGTKYASIVDFGFNRLKENGVLATLDFVGILDADCFPESQYYEQLTRYMANIPKIGISSGLMYQDDGSRDIASKDWVVGGCRLWKIACFNDSGYAVTPSADTISACKAILKGWEVKPNTGLKVISRKMGAKVNYKYYGYSWYYRGHTPLFGLLSTLKLFLRGEFKKSLEFFQGFFGSLVRNVPRIKDPDIINYYKNHLLRKVKSFKIK